VPGTPGRRNHPVGVERQARDLRFQRRRLPRLPADLGTRLPERATVAKVDQPGSGDIHQQRLSFQIAADPAQALQVDAQLIQTAGRTDVQFGQGRGADHAVVFQAVLGLEPLDRLHQLAVVVLVQGHRRP